MQDNPFVLGKYSPEFFCGRAEETALLKAHVENGRNVVMAGRKGVGKTTLIKHLFSLPDVRQAFYCFHIDVRLTHSPESLAHHLCSAVLREANEQRPSWLPVLRRKLSSVELRVQLDDDMNPKLTIGFGAVKAPEPALRQLLEFFDGLDRPVILALDEFQQVANYRDQTSEALIRSLVQRAPNVRMIFAGSRSDVLADMFLRSDRPFFQSAVFMKLESIPEAEYRDFAKTHFRRAGRTLPDEIFRSIFEKLDGVARFVHYVLNALFNIVEVGETATAAHLMRAETEIQGRLESFYYELFADVSDYQKRLLQAIAGEGRARMVASHDFCTRYGLGSVSSVQSGVRRLVQVGLVMKEVDGSLRVEDDFFRSWLQSRHECGQRRMLES